VAQLYIHQDGTTILQPVRRLDGFQRVTLAPGQTKTVTFTLGRDQVGFYNNLGQLEVDPGTVDVYVGDSSTAGLQTQFTVRS
jgi:beta-glucosidase